MISTTVSSQMFRNVDQTPETPVEDWCQQVVDTIIQYGESGDYLPLLEAIFEMPNSGVVERIRKGLSYADPEWCPNIKILNWAFKEGKWPELPTGDIRSPAFARLGLPYIAGRPQ